jgi:hypothetical protein
MRHGWRLALAVLLACAAPASADVPAGTSSASGGPVQATLSWSSGELFAEDPRLSVVRDGAQALDVRLVDECEFCTNLFEPPGDALAVQDLDGDAEPEVFVTTYSGGAHCCTSVVIYRWDGERYRRLTGFFGNAGRTSRTTAGRSSSPATTASPTASPPTRSRSCPRWCSATAPTPTAPTRCATSPWASRS